MSTSTPSEKGMVLNKWSLQSPQCFIQELLGDPGTLCMSKNLSPVKRHR